MIGFKKYYGVPSSFFCLSPSRFFLVSRTPPRSLVVASPIRMKSCIVSSSLIPKRHVVYGLIVKEQWAIAFIGHHHIFHNCNSIGWTLAPNRALCHRALCHSEASCGVWIDYHMRMFWFIVYVRFVLCWFDWIWLWRSNEQLHSLLVFAWLIDSAPFSFSQRSLVVVSPIRMKSCIVSSALIPRRHVVYGLIIIWECFGLLFMFDLFCVDLIGFDCEGAMSN
jgi:hypothetical protein